MKTAWIPVAVLALACFIRTGDATITDWTEPTIATITGTPAAAYTFAEDVATGTAGVGKTFAVTSDATPVVFTLLTAGTPFSIASATGVLSLDTAFDYETTATYTIEVQAVDATPTSGTATITVTVTDVEEAPAFHRAIYGVNIADGSTAGATLTTVTATDSDGDTITYSIDAVGNADGHFSIAQTGVITVATAKTLAASTTQAYALKVLAVDNSGSPLTGSTTIAVIVQSCSGGSSGLLAGSLLIVMMFFLELLK